MSPSSSLRGLAADWLGQLQSRTTQLTARGRELVLVIQARQERDNRGHRPQQAQPVKKPRPFVCVDRSGRAVRGAFEKLKAEKRPVACRLRYCKRLGPGDPGFDLVEPGQPCHLYEELPRNNQLAVTPGALLFLPYEHRVGKRLSTAEQKAFMERSKEAAFRHLTRDMQKFRGSFACLGISTHNLRGVIEAVCRLYLTRGSITYFDSREDKFTWVMWLHLDVVLPPDQVPGGFAKRCLKCVFGEYFVVTRDTKSTDFPKTVEQQEQTGQGLWWDYSEKTRDRIRNEARNYRNLPLKFLDQSTWDLFFPGAYDPLLDRVTESISIVRLHLAREFQMGTRFKSVPVLCTIVAVNLMGGADQMHYQLLQDAWGVGDFNRRLSGDWPRADPTGCP